MADVISSLSLVPRVYPTVVPICGFFFRGEEMGSCCRRYLASLPAEHASKVVESMSAEADDAIVGQLKDIFAETLRKRVGE